MVNPSQPKQTNKSRVHPDVVDNYDDSRTVDSLCILSTTETHSSTGWKNVVWWLSPRMITLFVTPAATKRLISSKRRDMYVGVTKLQ